ncbi:Rib/alpha-like domain-containing protein [Lactobacillus sp. ESL0684]|uniref:Rib/alpha-like domain-containing protein n=1 Tax=Lactobacillus sp. ESL0684 TaxID=2983213 RepID=UPI0023F7AC87|nr:Rib/alpha-like domain-containing protein [Lactobacillus sp. ESL0684]WEV43500.1 Rib/alpha-like domain-containing protein [Lactobacillus sp. ESL0684]
MNFYQKQKLQKEFTKGFKSGKLRRAARSLLISTLVVGSLGTAFASNTQSVQAGTEAPTNEPNQTQAQKADIRARKTIEVTQGEEFNISAKDAVTYPIDAVSAKWVDTPKTTDIGPQLAYVKVTFEDGSSVVVTVLVNVVKKSETSGVTEAEQYNPTAKSTIEVEQGKEITVSAKDAIEEFPADATAKWTHDVKTDKVGYQIANVEVTYKDGSSDQVPVLVNVKEKATTPNTSAPTTPAEPTTPTETPDPADPVSTVIKPQGVITVKQGQPFTVKAEDAVTKLPEGATANWVNEIKTDNAGPQLGYVEVTFADGKKQQVPVIIVVNAVNDSTESTVKGKDVVLVDQRQPFDVKAEDAVVGMPKDASAEWVNEIKTDDPGAQLGLVKVTFADKSTAVVPVLIIVKDVKIPQKDQYQIKAKGTIVLEQGAKFNVAAGDAITASPKLPSSARVVWDEDDQIDTNFVGEQTAHVQVIFLDDSIASVPVTVEVKAKQDKPATPPTANKPATPAPTTPPDNSTNNVPSAPVQTPANEVPSQPDKSATDTNQNVTTKTLKHNAAVYDENGNPTGVQSIKRGTTVKVIGTKTIAGKKYYQLDNGQYVKASNFKGTETKLKRKSYIYNKHGKRIGKKTLKKGKKVKTFGNKKIKGKLYASLGKGQYVKVANLK